MSEDLATLILAGLIIFGTVPLIIFETCFTLWLVSEGGARKIIEFIKEHINRG